MVCNLLRNHSEDGVQLCFHGVHGMHGVHGVHVSYHGAKCAELLLIHGFHGMHGVHGVHLLLNHGVYISYHGVMNFFSIMVFMFCFVCMVFTNLSIMVCTFYHGVQLTSRSFCAWLAWCALFIMVCNLLLNHGVNSVHGQHCVHSPRWCATYFSIMVCTFSMVCNILLDRSVHGVHSVHG